MAFREISPRELGDNVFDLFGKEYALLTVESEGKINPMTIGWGGLGVMWNRPVAFVVVRPERFTHELLSVENGFSLTAFGDDYRKQIGYCGSASGRDEDKVATCGFTVAHCDGVPYFEEARIAIMCKKLFASDYKEEHFLGNRELTEKWYGGGYHTLYIAEIEKILVRE